MVQLAAGLSARLVGPEMGTNPGTYDNTGLAGLVLVCKGKNPFREIYPGTIAKDNCREAAVPS